MERELSGISRARHGAWWAFGYVAFVVVATANGAGYRYGTSDQAFYIPVVVRALDPASFPRDASLIDSQGRLMVVDELIAAIAGATGLSLEALFAAGYLLSLLLIWAAIVAIGRTLYPTPWLIAALAAAFTLRHRIPHTSANSFEPYFHPRMLAFAVGTIAIAALLRRRLWTAVVLVAAAALVHITTALWFAVLIGVAAAVLDRRFRRLAIAGAAGVSLVLAWAFVTGPLRESTTVMDPGWLAALAAKDSIFPSTWPLWAWIANLALIGVAWISWISGTRWREAAARPIVEGRALLWGATTLVALFLLTLPLVAATMALPVQLQISRVFWLVDFVTLVCLVSLVRRERTARMLVVAIVALAAGRGTYIMTVEHPERPLFAARLPASDWHDAMRWMRTRPRDTHVLADPGHAWKYGTSVRVSAERDVLLEDVKDSAIAMYSRDVAMRYVERAAALAAFDALDADTVRQLARKYDVDYLVTESDLPLPVAYRNSRFHIYALAPERHGDAAH